MNLFFGPRIIFCALYSEDKNLPFFLENIILDFLKN